MESAGRLKCPNCAALVAPDAAQCPYCQVPLATQTCPSCMALVFVGFEHCPECGAEVVRPTAPAQASCPACKQPMSLLPLGDAQANQCGQCFGMWIEHAAFERICQSKEDHVVVLGLPTAAPAEQQRRSLPQVRYLPCPGCGKLMNRTNFARCSGVIIDSCKNHGIWFDRDELHEIVQFIEGGGLEKSREREALALAEQMRELEVRQRQLAAEQINAGINSGLGYTGGYSDPYGTLDARDVLHAVSAIGKLIKGLF